MTRKCSLIRSVFLSGVRLCDIFATLVAGNVRLSGVLWQQRFKVSFFSTKCSFNWRFRAYCRWKRSLIRIGVSLVCKINILKNICKYVLYHQIFIFPMHVPLSFLLVDTTRFNGNKDQESYFLLVFNWFAYRHKHIEIHVNKYSHTHI